MAGRALFELGMVPEDPGGDPAGDPSFVDSHEGLVAYHAPGKGSEKGGEGQGPNHFPKLFLEILGVKKKQGEGTPPLELPIPAQENPTLFPGELRQFTILLYGAEKGIVTGES